MSAPIFLRLWREGEVCADKSGNFVAAAARPISDF